MQRGNANEEDTPTRASFSSAKRNKRFTADALYGSKDN
jgi:hypothetical protein